MSEGKKGIDFSQVQSLMQMMGKGGAEGAAGAEGAVGGEGMMAAAMAAPEIVAAVIAGCILFFLAGGAYLNYWIADEYDKFVKVWYSDETDGWGWYHFWHALMDVSFLIWFWEIWFGPRALSQTGGVSRYRCTNGIGELCGGDEICQNLDKLGSAMDNLGLWLGWWDPTWDDNTYKCEEGSCYPGYHVNPEDRTHCGKNECTCLGAVSNKGPYTWKTGDASGEVCLAHNGHGCMDNTCNTSSFYSHSNCFPSMTCGCPASDFNGNTIKNDPGADIDCIKTLPTGAGQTSGPICISADGTETDQTTESDCTDASGIWYEHSGCGTCQQPNPMSSDQRAQCLAELSPSGGVDGSCSSHGSNCIYTANPGESPTCTISDSGNIFSKNQGTGRCEEKICTCVSDTGTYAEQRGIPNTGDDCTENGLNSCQSCYDGFVSDPTNVRGHNECLLPSTDQSEGSFCWEEQGILCADTYYCGNTETLNFALGAKGMCLPKHQYHNPRGADASDILDADCNIEPASNPYKPGFGHENSDDKVTPLYDNLQKYMTSKSGCDPAERITKSRVGTTGGSTLDGKNYRDGANTCTDGRECESGICAGPTTLGIATLNCYQGPAQGIGSCCDPTWEATDGGFGSDSTLEYRDKYYGTSPGDHSEVGPQRNRIMNNQWWSTHGETINAAMSGRA